MPAGMKAIRYLSVCSGIEAATVAWHPLGWRPVAFSEIEKFPSAVLAHHHPRVPNWGDLTRFKEWPDAAVDLLVGGTPCQDYSIAGLRAGMAGDRGALTRTFVEVAERYQPTWVVWENVPGVFSSNGGRDFAAFLCDLGACGYGWAYRVLDAQYVRTRRFPRAVAQRRRRVFVIGYLGDWRRAAAVLFDRESLRGDPAPRRKPGQGPAPTISARPTGGGALGTDFDLDGGLIAHSLRGEGFDASEDGTGRGTPLVPVAMPLTAGMGKSASRMPHEQGALVPVLQPIAFDCLAGGQTGLSTGDVPGALHGGGKSGGRLAVAFDCKGSQVQHDDSGVSPTLRAMGHAASRPNAGGQLAVAFDLRGREGGAMPEGPHNTANIRAASGRSSRSYVAHPWAVRRLTPRECERLQGFPDDYTLIPHRGRMAADGPRYKALGNSMAVNVMEWIGERIALVDEMDGQR